MLRLAVAATSLLCVIPGIVAGLDTGRLKPGVFLYAAPGLQDRNFAESVVLLVQHGAEGSLGLIVNRPTQLPVREALTELGELRGLDLPVYFGGPVQPEAVLALVRSPRPVDGAVRALPDVYFCSDLKPVKAAARRAEVANRLRVYAGYAGWSPGQLAQELRLGAWVVGPADARSVFSSDPSSLWLRVEDLLRRIEVRLLAAPAGAERTRRGVPARSRPDYTSRGGTRDSLEVPG